MILLDTNIISELLRKTPEPKVALWLAAQQSSGVYLSAVSEAELRLGVAIMPPGHRRAAGRPISQFDCQIAAIARSNGAAVATRNVRDFEGCGIVIIDPWQDFPEERPAGNDT